MWCGEWPFPPYVLFSGIPCYMHSYPHVPFVLVAEGPRVASILVLLFLFSFYMLLFTLEIGWCFWLLVQLSTSFDMSRKSFSMVWMNLSYSNCIGSIWILYLLLMYGALFLTSFIRVSCNHLMLTGSAKLMLPTWLHSTSFCSNILHQHLASGYDMMSQVLLAQN